MLLMRYTFSKPLIQTK